MIDWPVRVLIVEDNPGDLCLIKLLLRSWESPDVIVLHRGDAAIWFIDNLEAEPAVPIPDLVLLDLNLPGASGIEILTRLRGSSRLSDVPVAILSSSIADADRRRALANGANSFISKPANFEEYLAMGRSIENTYLLDVASRRDADPQPVQ